MKKALAVVLASLVTLVACEAALRWLWHNPYYHETPDHLLKLSMHHGRTDLIFDRRLIDANSPQIRLRTDARSYILPSFQHPDPNVTIAFLGGSTTECMAVQEELRFPALVSTLLAEKGQRVNTLNAARSGNDLHDSLNILLNHVVDDRPDFAVLMHVSNDVGYLSTIGNYRDSMGSPVTVLDLGKWFLQMTSSHSYLAGLTRYSTTATVRPQNSESDWRYDSSVLDRLPSEPYRQRLETFVHMARAFGIEPVLVTEPFTGSTNALTPAWLNRTGQDKFNSIVREVGSADGVLVIDLVRHLQEQVPDWNKQMEIFYDAIHVTDKGSRIYASHIAERLLPVILKREEAGSH